MKFLVEPSVSPSDAAVFRRVLGRYPDDYLCLLARNGDRYTMWFQLGQYGYHAFLYAKGRPMEVCEEDMLFEAQRSIQAIAHSQQEQPGLVADNSEPTVEDYIRTRLTDFERTMTKTQIEEALAKGQLAGLEFLQEEA